jgi:hypothetical protein
MSASSVRRFPNIIEAAILAKPHLKKSSVNTFRGDAAAILESLVAELSEDAIVKAMNHQGFTGKAYLPAIRTLAKLAQERRSILRKPKS